MATDEGTQSGLSSFTWTPWGIRALVPAAASCTHLMPQGVQKNLGKTRLVLVSPMLVDNPEFYLVVDQVPVPSQLKHTRGRCPIERYQGIPTYWMGLCWKILGNIHPVRRSWGGVGRELFEGYQGNTHPVERYWVRFSWKILRNTWGLVERHQGCSVVGDLNGLCWVLR